MTEERKELYDRMAKYIRAITRLKGEDLKIIFMDEETNKIIFQAGIDKLEQLVEEIDKELYNKNKPK